MEKKKALAAVMATMLIASSLTACGGTKDTENMDDFSNIISSEHRPSALTETRQPQ